jgi:hypothetical protein
MGAVHQRRAPGGPRPRRRVDLQSRPPALAQHPIGIEAASGWVNAVRPVTPPTTAPKPPMQGLPATERPQLVAYRPDRHPADQCLRAVAERPASRTRACNDAAKPTNSGARHPQPRLHDLRSGHGPRSSRRTPGSTPARTTTLLRHGKLGTVLPWVSKSRIDRPAIHTRSKEALHEGPRSTKPAGQTPGGLTEWPIATVLKTVRLNAAGLGLSRAESRARSSQLVSDQRKPRPRAAAPLRRHQEPPDERSVVESNRVPPYPTRYRAARSMCDPSPCPVQ